MQLSVTPTYQGKAGLKQANPEAFQWHDLYEIQEEKELELLIQPT